MDPGVGTAGSPRRLPQVNQSPRLHGGLIIDGPRGNRGTCGGAGTRQPSWSICRAGGLVLGPDGDTAGSLRRLPREH